MIHLRAFKELFILFFFFFFFSFLFFFSFHSQPTISGEAHGERRFGKTLVIGLCIVKSDRLSDSHTNYGGESGGRGLGFGGWDAVSLFPYSRTRHLLSFFCFPLALPCLAFAHHHGYIGLVGGENTDTSHALYFTCYACMFGGPPPLPRK